MTIARAKVPKQIGRYQLVYELAPSYLGPLWVARIDGGDGLAMLRLVSLARLDADVRVRLLEAAWQAMEVRDDRVAAVSDVVASDGELSIVSEYAEGLPLRAVASLASVRRKPMSVSVALRFIVDLADGVVALHGAMTELGDEAVPLYGGLSVDSVLVGAAGRASLLDVSIASAASGVPSLGGSPERVAYAAPEQVGAPGTVDARTDVFSLGTMAWEMLANRRLFVGSDKAVTQKVLAAKVPKLEDASRKGELEVPRSLGAVVLRALSLDPSARFESMAAFRAALDAVGVAPAPAEEAARYIAAIGDGALGRIRDAISPPSRPRPSEAAPAARAPEPTTAPEAVKAPEPVKARPSLEPGGARAAHKPLSLPVRVGAERRVLAPRASVEPKARVIARPSVEPRTAPVASTASEEPKPVMTSRRVSIEPKPGDGWRALDAPPSVRSVPPANIRPRQATMIGLPAPAGLEPEATPPAVATTAPSEAPISSSDEPTGQYSREHLKQLSELRAPTPPSPAPLDLRSGASAQRPQRAAPHAATPAEPTTGAAELTRATMPAPAANQTPLGPPVTLNPPPVPVIGPPKVPVRPDNMKEVPLPRLVSLQPTPRPLSEIHTERPPPPDPEPTPPTPHVAPAAADVARAFDQATSSPEADRFARAQPSRAAAPLPPAGPEPAPVSVAGAPPPARMEAPFAARHAAPSLSPPAERTNAPRTADGAMSAGLAARNTERAPFSRPPPATPSASYYPSSQIAPPLIHDPRANRAPSPTPRHPPQFTRGVLLGVVVSLGLVVASAAVTLFILGGRDAGGRDAEARAERERSAARSEALAASSATAPVVTSTAAEPAETTAASGDGAEAAAQPATTPSSAAASAPAPSRAPARAAHPSRSGRKPAKKHGHFVPDDI